MPKSHFTPKSGGPRQLRRPVPKGLSQGEKLFRMPLIDTTSFSEWGWVGTEVHSATEIGPQHRATACGFRKHVCRNKHTPIKAPSPPMIPQELEDDVVVISDDEPECCAKTCKTNPNCCNYLGQSKWQQTASALKLFLEAGGLEPDPRDELRLTEHPVGLKNLGATCYANSIIQVWFQDLEFRVGVYKCVPELSLPPGKTIEESPVYQLQFTFGALQHSNQKSFNPVKFVECLGIRTAEQQDAQEFSKLFMSHLDNEFKKQQDIPLRSLITDQFEGSRVYGTRCTGCNKSSEHHSSFLELEISLTYDCKLEERLTASLEDEKLDGENQYDCSTCGSKQDAFRYQRITQLPPVLHFSVLRFVFDPKDMDRKKSKRAISYPLSINMRSYVAQCESDIWYDLRGVLLHRGSSAYHGHYEAQVFDVTRDKWFLFNDEQVKELEKEELIAKQTNGALRSQGSKDAYMLIYAQRGVPPVDSTALNLPKHTQKAVDNLNAVQTGLCEAYTKKRESLELEFTIVRQNKQDIYQTWHISSMDEISMVLSRKDLEDWISIGLDKNIPKHPACPLPVDKEPLPTANEDSGLYLTRPMVTSPSPPPLDEVILGSVSSGPNGGHLLKPENGKATSLITCIHGLLDPAQSANMKRISKTAWVRIIESGTNAVALESNQVCENCTAVQFNEKLYALKHIQAVAHFEDGMLEDKGREWWISKNWLKDWKLKRPKMHISGCRDPAPNSDQYASDIYCEHYGLVHSQKSREKISTAALRVLQELFPGLDPPGVTTETCSVCEAVAANDREATKEARAKAEAERMRLLVLSRRTLSDLGALRFIEGLDYNLIPLSFVNQWRMWLAKPLLVPRPGPVANHEFMCEHGNLVVNPIESTDVDGVMCDITREEWNIIHELYGGGPVIECSVEESKTNPGKDELWSNIPVCTHCRTIRLSNFDNADINVYRLAEGEPLPWATSDPIPSTPPRVKSKAIDQEVIHIEDTDVESPTLSDSSPPARAPGNKKRMKPITYGQRRSKRIRKAATATTEKGTFFSINISRDDTIREIKHKIEKAEGILSFYQQLYLNGAELTDDTQTVSQIGMLRTDRFILRAIEAMDEDDAVAWALTSGNVEPPKPARGRAEGRAFGGTLLDGSTYDLPVSGPSKPAAERLETSRSSAKESGSSADPPESDHDQPMRTGSSSPTSPSEPFEGVQENSTQQTDRDAEKQVETMIAEVPCPHCTLLNPPFISSCEVCEGPLTSS